MSEPADNVYHLTKENIEELKAKKLISEQESDVELDPVAGFEVMGTLLEEERVVFLEMLATENILNDFGKELYARSAEAVAETTRNVDSPEELRENLLDRALFQSREEAEDFFYETAKHDFLKTLFWFNVRERLQTFATSLTIRAGFTVCKTGYKYKR